MNGSGPSLRSLLVDRAEAKCRLSARVGMGLIAGLIFLTSVALWSTISLDRVKSNSLYGILAVFATIMIGGIIYGSLNIARSSGWLNSLDSTRAWHKRGYKILSGLAIIEHGVIFTCIAVVLYHALGLSLTRCLSRGSCQGINFENWQTVSSAGKKFRTQELVSSPVTASISDANMAVFIGFLVSMFLGILVNGVYVYGEACRRSCPPGGKVRPAVSLFGRRKQLVNLMIFVSLLQLIFSIIGAAIIGAGWWFPACIVISFGSWYPLCQLQKGLTKDVTITRFQFRKVSQLCLSLVFLWMYATGLGVYAALVSGVRLTSGEIVSLISGSALVQIVLMLVLHVAISILSFVGIYVHLSITDIIESIRKTDDASAANDAEKAIPSPPTETGTPQNVPEYPTPQAPPMVWDSPQCASCSTNPSNCILVPCGHSVVCSDCSRVLLTIPGFRCPVCCMEVIDSQTAPNKI